MKILEAEYLRLVEEGWELTNHLDVAPDDLDAQIELEEVGRRLDILERVLD